MEWLGDILGGVGGALANVASGGLLGLAGSIVGAVSKHVQERQRQAWQEKVWGHELQLQRLQMEARAQETEQELAIAQSEGSWRGLEISHQQAMTLGPVHTWVNDIRSLFRPALTVLLWLTCGVALWLLTSGLVAGYLKEATVSGLVEYTVRSVVFAASTATVWWFGDRALQPPRMKHR